MSTRRGGSLENAILRASRAYRRDGVKIVLVKQEPRQSAHGQQNGYAAGSAPVDFIGAIALEPRPAHGKPLALEAKTTKGKSLPMDRVREDQIALMGHLYNAGADVHLVCYFSDLDEPYAVPWPEVATFLAMPWRSSFSLAWFRVHGLLLPQREERDGHWEVQFLNGRTHPKYHEACVELAQDKARDRSSGSGDSNEEAKPEVDDVPIDRPSDATSEEERRERVARAYAEGVRRQQKKAGAGGGWYGGR